METSHRLPGRCHCGNLEVELETRRTASELPARACSCTFCRPRRTRWTSDPEGRARVRVHDDTELSRYRFGTGTADFLVCRRCGMYVAAVHDEGGRRYAVVNISVLASADEFPEAVSTSFDGETEAQRRSRRLRSWTPAEVVVERR